MAGNVKFDIKVAVSDPDLLPELEARLGDLSPAFNAIIPEWAHLNESKFDLSIGRESSGADVDENVFWEQLKPASMRAKRKAGQPDQIMVATGSLKRALTNPDLIFQYVSAEEAVFGTPRDLDDAQKVIYQWLKRQAVFLSTLDQNVIRRTIQDYFSLGGDFQQKRFAAGAARAAQRREMQALDEEFAAVVGDTGDGF